MRKTIKKLISAFLFVTLLFLCSCRLIEVGREFYIKNITDHLDEDYFTSKNFEFAKVDSVVFVPYIRGWSEGFVVYIRVYSKTGAECVTIKNIYIRDHEDVLLTCQLNKKISFKQTDDLLYLGRLDGRLEYDNVIFTDEQVEIVSDKEYDLIVSVEVVNGDITISHSITYECVVVIYKSSRLYGL